MVINPAVIEKGKVIIEGIAKIKAVFQPIIDKLEEQFGPLGSSANVVSEKKEFINKDALIALAKANVAEGANGICALLKKSESNYIIWLANIKDNDFLPTEKNKFVKIETEALSRDVETLFENTELIILK